MSKEAPVCFVIAPIGEDDSETRQRSDRVLKHIITPAVQECGYRVERADLMPKAGMITGQVVHLLRDAPLVVADLSEHNANVFYELAVRHALRRPFIQLIRKGDRIPFDVSDVRTITYDHHDLQNAEDTRGEIVRQARALQQDTSPVETPLSQALGTVDLQQSTIPTEKTLGELLVAVTDLRVKFGDLEAVMRVGAPPAGLSREFLLEVNQLVSSLVQNDSSGEDARPELRPLLDSLSRHCRREMLREER